MAETMTPSETTKTSFEMTDGQINKAVDQLRDALRKHRDEFSSEAVQQVLGTGNFGMQLLEPFRKLVEEVIKSNLIIRRVTVDRSMTPQEALKATGRTRFFSVEVVNNMPQGEGDEVEVVLFNLGRLVDDDELDKEFKLRGLVPVDPFTLAAFNAANPTFADEHPNVTYWEDVNNDHCCAVFDSFCSVRVLCRGGQKWNGRLWFAGVRRK